MRTHAFVRHPASLINALCMFRFPYLLPPGSRAYFTALFGDVEMPARVRCCFVFLLQFLIINISIYNQKIYFVFRCTFLFRSFFFLGFALVFFFFMDFFFLLLRMFFNQANTRVFFFFSPASFFVLFSSFSNWNKTSSKQTHRSTLPQACVSCGL